MKNDDLVDVGPKLSSRSIDDQEEEALAVEVQVPLARSRRREPVREMVLDPLLGQELLKLLSFDEVLGEAEDDVAVRTPGPLEVVEGALANFQSCFEPRDLLVGRVDKGDIGLVVRKVAEVGQTRSTTDLDVLWH